MPSSQIQCCLLVKQYPLLGTHLLVPVVLWCLCSEQQLNKEKNFNLKLESKLLTQTGPGWSRGMTGEEKICVQ